MAEVKLRKDFYGTLIPKVSSDNLRVVVGFDYKGPAQTLDIETNTGKRGLWGDYDQESPTYHDSKTVYKSETFRHYTFSRYIPLSFWGTRQIEDCAVEVVITGEGIHEDAILWDAYKVGLALVTFHVRPMGGVPDVGVEKAWTCYYWDPNKGEFVGDGKWYDLPDTRRFRDVQPGGYLAAFYLDYSGNVSRQYNSDVFSPEDGATYVFSLPSGTVTKV